MFIVFILCFRGKIGALTLILSLSMTKTEKHNTLWKMENSIVSLGSMKSSLSIQCKDL